MNNQTLAAWQDLQKTMIRLGEKFLDIDLRVIYYETSSFNLSASYKYRHDTYYFSLKDSRFVPVTAENIAAAKQWLIDMSRKNQLAKPCRF